MQKKISTIAIALASFLFAVGQDVVKLKDSLPANGLYAEYKASASNAVSEIRIDDAHQLKISTIGKDLNFIYTRYWLAPEKMGKKIVTKRNFEHYNYRLKKLLDSTYKFYFTVITDSASDTRQFAAYISEPKSLKWKLFASYTAYNYKQKLEQFYFTKGSFKNRMYNAGKWKKIDSTELKMPSLRPFTSIDSAAQHQLELAKIKAQLKDSNATYKEGLYYKIMNTTNGAKVALTDTVEVFYKGWTMFTNEVFDETKAEPIKFPLLGLIKGWQIGMVEAHVGEKVRMWIPSPTAYGIRNLATTIPPNSILVFDVEVVSAKPKE